MDLAREKLELERLKLELAQAQAAAGAARAPMKAPSDKVRTRSPSSRVPNPRGGAGGRGGRPVRSGGSGGLVLLGLLGAAAAIGGAVWLATHEPGAAHPDQAQADPSQPVEAPPEQPDEARPDPPRAAPRVTPALRRRLDELKTELATAPAAPGPRRAALSRLLSQLSKLGSESSAEAALPEIERMERAVELALADLPSEPRTETQPAQPTPAENQDPEAEGEDEDPFLPLAPREPQRPVSDPGREEAPLGPTREEPAEDEEPTEEELAKAGGGTSASPALLRAFALALQYHDREDRARLEKCVAELERLAPDSPQAAAGRGLLADLTGRFNDAVTELEKSGELGGEFTAAALVRSLFATMRYEAARRALPRLTEREQELWGTLIDGPFKKTYPLAAEACVATTPDGHYRVITDLGLPSDFLPKLEKKLQGLSPSEQAKQVARAARSHKGLQELCDVMDKAYKAYGKLLQTDAAQQVFPTVYVLQSRSDFDRFSASLEFHDMENVLGYYVPGLRILVFYDQPEGRIAGRRLSQGTLEVLLHETFHQWLHLHIDEAPRWFDEGMAEYFGIGEMTASGLRYGLVPTIHPSRLDNIREALTGGYGEPMKVVDMIRAPRSTFYGANAAINYAQAWSFVHYLGSNSRGQKLLREYFKALARGSDQEAAFRDVFGELDMQAMDRDWREYVGKLR